MTPIEAAIKGSNEIFCSNFYFYHAGRSIPTGYISRRLWDVYLGIWCRNRCCRFNFGICIIDTMLNAYLMKAANKKNQNFII
jgi:hypothetical protein